MIEAMLPHAPLIRRKAASGGRYDAQGPSGTRDGPVDDSVDCLFEGSGSACAQTVDEAVITLWVGCAHPVHKLTS